MTDEELSEQPTIELLARVRSGNESAREALYQRHLARLRRWARGRLPRDTRSVLDTDDVVQKVLADSLHHVEAFEPRHSGAFLAYLRTSVLHSIRDEVRRVVRRGAEHESAGAVLDSGPSPLELAIGSEKLERYELALSGLSASDREAVVARIELGLSYKEIASELGKSSPDAARMAVSRAVCRLARRMQRGA